MNIACYFNSILQVYYTIPGFVNSILENKDSDEDKPAAAGSGAKNPNQASSNQDSHPDQIRL